jgi:hypothetical protein
MLFVERGFQTENWNTETPKITKLLKAGSCSIGNIRVQRYTGIICGNRLK